MKNPSSSNRTDAQQQNSSNHASDSIAGDAMEAGTNMIETFPEDEIAETSAISRRRRSVWWCWADVGLVLIGVIALTLSLVFVLSSENGNPVTDSWDPILNNDDNDGMGTTPTKTPTEAPISSSTPPRSFTVVVNVQEDRSAADNYVATSSMGTMNISAVESFLFTDVTIGKTFVVDDTTHVDRSSSLSFTLTSITDIVLSENSGTPTTISKSNPDMQNFATGTQFIATEPEMVTMQISQVVFDPNDGFAVHDCSFTGTNYIPSTSTMEIDLGFGQDMILMSKCESKTVTTTSAWITIIDSTEPSSTVTETEPSRIFMTLEADYNVMATPNNDNDNRVRSRYLTSIEYLNTLFREQMRGIGLYAGDMVSRESADGTTRLDVTVLDIQPESHVLLHLQQEQVIPHETALWLSDCTYDNVYITLPVNADTGDTMQSHWYWTLGSCNVPDFTATGEDTESTTLQVLQVQLSGTVRSFD